MLPDVTTVTNDSLMLWVMHRFSVVFKDHALLKGGMQLMLLNSHRATNDIDYVFSPFKSKKEVEEDIDLILQELIGAKFEKSMHSNTGRYLVEFGDAKVQIEYNVSMNVKSESVSTKLLAEKVGVLPKVIRVMASDVALSHKIAAWNERRLIRDLYDVYFWVVNSGVKPDFPTLTTRLSSVNSRLPKLKKVNTMTLAEFCQEFHSYLDSIDEQIFVSQLQALVPRSELEGQFIIFRSNLKKFIATIEVEAAK